MRHKHRIVPGYMGGTYDEDNIAYLTPMEHADAHNLLYCLYKNKEDKLAELGLLGYADKQYIIKELLKLNCSKSWDVGMTEARQEWYSSDKLSEHGKWLSSNHSVFNDSSAQSELGKRAAKSSKHPNNVTKTCPHCNKTMNLGSYSRWHGNNCKKRSEINDLT